jgi:hypothetical protein
VRITLAEAGEVEARSRHQCEALARGFELVAHQRREAEQSIALLVAHLAVLIAVAQRFGVRRQRQSGKQAQPERERRAAQQAQGGVRA